MHFTYADLNLLKEPTVKIVPQCCIIKTQAKTFKQPQFHSHRTRIKTPCQHVTAIKQISPFSINITIIRLTVADYMAQVFKLVYKTELFVIDGGIRKLVCNSFRPTFRSENHTDSFLAVATHNCCDAIQDGASSTRSST